MARLNSTIMAAGLYAIISSGCAAMPNQLSENPLLSQQIANEKQSKRISNLNDAVHDLSSAMPEYRSWMVCAGFRRNAYALAQDQEADLLQIKGKLESGKVELTKKEERRIIDAIARNKESWTRFLDQSRKEITQNPIYRSDKTITMFRSCDNLEQRMNGDFRDLIEEANEIRSYFGIKKKQYR